MMPFISHRIDLYRGFLCQYVIFSHLIPTLFPSVLGTPGTLAVWCFFIVSGYLNAISFTKSITTKEYFIKRIRRLYPLLLLSYVVIAFCEKTLFINDFWTLVPMIIDVKSQMPINGVLWTIIIELQLYLLTPLFYKLVKNSNLFNHWSVINVIFAFSFISIILSVLGSSIFVGKTDLDDRMLFFTIPFYCYGMMLANIENLTFPKKNFFYGACLLFMVIVYSRNFSSLWSHLFLEGRLIPFLVTSLVLFPKTKSVSSKKYNLFIFLGKATFEIYLFHGLFVYMFHHFFIHSKGTLKIFIFYWIIPTVIGLSAVLLFERNKKSLHVNIPEIPELKHG